MCSQSIITLIVLFAKVIQWDTLECENTDPVVVEKMMMIIMTLKGVILDVSQSAHSTTNHLQHACSQCNVKYVQHR